MGKSFIGSSFDELAKSTLGEVDDLSCIIDGDGFVTKSPIKNDIQAISDFISDYRVVDFTQRLRRDHAGEIIFNFGKYVNKRVKDVFRRDKNYYHWIIQKDFSSQVKKIVKALMEEVEAEEKQ